MIVSLNWIKQYVNLPDDICMDELAHDLTMRTVEVESVSNPKDDLENIIIGRIVSVDRHPNADKLSVCMVDIGTGEDSQIVCGGSNLKEDMLVAIALPGSFVRWHGEGEKVKIKSSKLRGVKSEGMICASEELCLETLFPSKSEAEIMDLSSFKASAGDELASVLELDDILLEIDNKSMTNRPDLWGHYGIAREIAAIYELPLKPLPEFSIEGDIEEYPVKILSNSCYRYAGLLYDGLQNVSSPYTLRKQLHLCGVRPINAMVDITNYIMLCLGQPTHGFDSTHVKGGIVVRDANAGEKLTLLDGQKLNLTSSDLLICDSERAMALAGIMGGGEDSILPDTTSMLLEIATFNPISIRRSANLHKVHTDSSLRNEKGLDTQRVDSAMGVADDIIKKLFPESRLIAFGDAKTHETKQEKVICSIDWINTRLGRKLTFEEINSSLTPLGFVANHEGDSIIVDVPSFRSTGDVSLPDDILEEIARMIGYENFEYKAPKVTLNSAVNNLNYQLERAVCEYLAAGCGMQDIFTYPWMEKQYMEAVGVGEEDCLKLASPPSPETSCLRNTLIPGMIKAVSENLRYRTEFKLFEMAQVFSHGEYYPSEKSECLPLQQLNLCGAFVGEDIPSLIRLCKGALEALPRICMAEEYEFTQVSKPLWADKNAWANIVFNGDTIGCMGLVSVKTEKLAGIKHSSCMVFEINIDSLVPLASRSNSYVPVPVYPQVEQDFSIILDENISWEQLESTIKPLVNKVAFIEEYRGKQVPEGKKSVLVRVWFGSDTSTLSSDDISANMKKIIKQVENKLGGSIRDEE